MASCEPTVAHVDFTRTVGLFYAYRKICHTCSGLTETNVPEIVKNEIGKLRCICHEFDTHQF